MLVFVDESGDPGLKLASYNSGKNKKPKSYPPQRNAHHTVTIRIWVNSVLNIKILLINVN